MVALHARIGLTDDDALTRHPKLIPHPLGPDERQVPLLGRGNAFATDHTLGDCRERTQHRAMQNSFYLRLGFEPPTMQWPPFYLKPINQIIGLILYPKLR